MCSVNRKLNLLVPKIFDLKKNVFLPTDPKIFCYVSGNKRFFGGPKKYNPSTF